MCFNIFSTSWFFCVHLLVWVSVSSFACICCPETKQDFYEHRGKLTACIIVVICEKLQHSHVFSTIFDSWPLLLPRVRNYVYGHW